MDFHRRISLHMTPDYLIVGITVKIPNWLYMDTSEASFYTSGTSKQRGTPGSRLDLANLDHHAVPYSC